MGGPAADVRQAARDAVQHPGAADRGGAGGRRLRRHGRGWARGAEPRRGARAVHRADRRAAALIAENRAAVRGGGTLYYRVRGRGGGAAKLGARFDVRPVLLDPPYDYQPSRDVLDAAADTTGTGRDGGAGTGDATRAGRAAVLVRVRDVKSGDSTLDVSRTEGGVREPVRTVTNSAGPPSGRLAIFPGSFDPLTNGHVDIVLRSAHLFERVIVAVLVNPEKQPLFTPDERVAIIREVFREYPNVEVDTFNGLLVDYARRRRASAIVRGMRAVSDFEHEFQMALMNRHLEPTLETVFMMPAEQYTYLSSRLIKEVFSLGGDVRGLVPPAVERWMRRKTGAVRQD